MKAIALVVLAILALYAAADETEEEPKPVSKDVGLQINHCHPGDSAFITVIPIPENDVRCGGMFNTTNTILTLDDLSMLPSGLNRLQIRSVCRGLTGEVSSVVIDLQRPPPPPKLSIRKVRRVAPASPVPTRFNTTSNTSPPMPPLPPGMAGMLPLPGGATNRISYKDQVMMKAYFSKPGRRSQ